MNRTMQDVQREYQQAVLELGAETYKVFALEEELELTQDKVLSLQGKMRQLNREASKLAQKQKNSEQSVMAEVVKDEQSQS